MSEPKLIFADVETTAVRPFDRPGGTGEIWELALIIRDPGLEPDQPGYGVDAEWAWHFRPPRLSHADPGALRIGGYYDRCESPDAPVMAYHYPDWEKPSEVAPLLGEVALWAAFQLDGAHLIGANMGSFDVQHIDAWLRDNGQVLTADYHYTDLGSLVRGWAAGKDGFAVTVPWPLKLHDAAVLVGLDPGKYDTHTGLGDCRLGRDIFDVVTTGSAPHQP